LQAGVPVETLVVQDVPADSSRSGVDAVMSHEPGAVICANDATAATLMRQMLDAGIDIPGRVRVAGFDDVKYASLLSVPLTTYRQPCADMGRSAVDTMQLRLAHPDAVPHRNTLQGQLIVRQSTE
ncbi:MAG: substrate-binding domain-containing protein, partial [Verrucomicrobia bacterium]|nr:substrate-binding domain-containing protein [Verrucomicrobiota bacterium]